LLFGNTMIEGNDLGIFFYIGGWILVGIFFTFTANQDIKDLLEFYLPYELMAILFLTLQFAYLHKKFDFNALETENVLNTPQTYEFLQFKSLKKKKVIKAIIYIALFFGAMTLINFLFNGVITPYFGEIDFINNYSIGSYLVLQVTRMVIIEELVFRGLIIAATVIGFTKLLNLTKMSKENSNKIAIIMAVLFSSILFGFLHKFHYNDSTIPLITLSILGILCAILTIKFGIWAAIILHMINNVMAAFTLDQTMFSGNMSLLTGVLNWTFVVVMILFFLGLFIIYFIMRKLDCDLLVFNYASLSFIAFFIIGFYTNNLIKSEYINNLIYFEHFHLILFLPAFYIYFRNKFSQKKLYSLIVGCSLGFFVSDYFDIIQQSLLQLVYTTIYVLIAAFIYTSINLYLSSQSKKIRTAMEL
ncbi:MAG: CPBP family intramembrane glutamic endopeptidase, partial [Promethearchaeota archaeon]